MAYYIYLHTEIHISETLEENRDIK